MPKPVLSDSLFNASDVAEAIVDTVDFGVINTNLGVTDISHSFSKDSNYTYESGTGVKAYKFNGFVFVSFVMYRTTNPSNNDVVMTITNSAYYPAVVHVAPSISYEGDVINFLRFNTNGEISINSPTNVGQSSFSICANAHYRT